MTPMHCLLSQWVAARRLDDGTEVPRWTQRHLDHCPDCAAQHQRHRSLVARLSGDADAVRREPPPFLHARILANLGTQPSVRPGARRVSPLWTVAAAGVAAVVLIVALDRAPESARPLASGVPQVDSPVVRGTFAFLSTLPAQETVLALGTNLDEPLATELQLVMSDARTALAALTRNFLPGPAGEPQR